MSRRRRIQLVHTAGFEYHAQTMTSERWIFNQNMIVSFFRSTSGHIFKSNHQQNTSPKKTSGRWGCRAGNKTTEFIYKCQPRKEEKREEYKKNNNNKKMWSFLWRSWNGNANLSRDPPFRYSFLYVDERWAPEYFNKQTNKKEEEGNVESDTHNIAMKWF